MWDQKDLAAAVVVILLEKKKKKRVWVNEWLKKRPVYTHERLLKDLSSAQQNDFQNYIRMDIAKFEQLLKLVKPFIEKKNTVMRDAISVHQRLSITLQYLATGHTFQDLKFSSGISPQALGIIIMETCTSIIRVLKDYIKMPQTSEEWKEVATDFEIKWNAPHILGAIDGKHVQIKKPTDSGSMYLNYKKQFSIVLMAVVNANYEFILVDAGANGRVPDEGVLQNTEFGKKLKDKALNIPNPAVVTGTTRILPYVFIGDDAFPLGPSLVTPYSQSGLTKAKSICNYRLSHARRPVESAFGILATRFGVFQRPFALSPLKVQKIVLACCYLHNFLRKSTSYMPQTLLPYEDRESETINVPTQQTHEMLSLSSINQQNTLEIAKKTRNAFSEYFNNEGAVD